MTLANKSLVTMDDLSNGEIMAVFTLADEMSAKMKESPGFQLNSRRQVDCPLD